MTPLELADWFYFDALMSPLSWWILTGLSLRAAFQRV